MIHVRTLGTALIDAEGTRVDPKAIRKFALLLYLAAERGRRIPRGALHDLIFPDKPTVKAQHSLREMLYELRQCGVPILSDANSIELPPETVERDYDALGANARPERTQLEAALGGFLPGYSPEHSEAYREWLDQFRSRSAFELCASLSREIDRARADCDWSATELAARACLGLSPLHEKATLALAQALAMGGAKVQAVQLLDEYNSEIPDSVVELRLPATILKRRIAEQTVGAYRSSTDSVFIGRDDEMRQLRETFNVVREGERRCVVIAGEPGLGKTRLAAEFSALASIGGARVTRVTAQPHDVWRTMGAFVDLVPILLKTPGAIGCSPSSMQALSRLTSRGTLTQAADERKREPEELAYEITQAIEDVIEAITAEAPLVVVFEDAHWLDEPSVRVLVELICNRASSRLMFIVTTRDRARLSTESRQADCISLIDLNGLDAESARKLSRGALLGTPHADDGAVHEWMATTSMGNPLFVESLASHYRTSGVAFTVPPTLRDLIARRVDVLGHEATAVLQACVVLGKHSTAERLVSVLGGSYIGLLSAIAELTRARAIESSAEGVVPAHPLIAEVVQEATPPVSLRLLHGRVAELLESEARASDSMSLLWECAEHWSEGGDHERAFALMRECAEHAMKLGQARAAADVLLQASSLPISRPEKCQTLRDAIVAANAGREHEFVIQAAERLHALDQSRQHDEAELAELASLCSTLRYVPEMEPRGLECLVCRDATPEHRVRAAVLLLKLADSASRPQLADQVTAAVAEADLEAIDTLLRLEYWMVFHSCFGSLEDAAETAVELQRLSHFEPSARAASLEYNSAVALERAGRTAEAIEGSERAAILAISAGAFRLCIMSHILSAELLFDRGDHIGGWLFLNWAEAIRREHPRSSDGIEIEVLRIDLELATGSPDVASQVLARAQANDLFRFPIRTRWNRAFECRLRQLTGGTRFSDAELESLIATGVTHTSTGGLREFELGVAYFELCRRNNRSAARALLTRYISEERRSRGGFTVLFQQAMLDAGIAGSTTA